MDAFKFAFETMIVGLLALPWLVLMAFLLLPPFQINNTKENVVLSTLLQPSTLTIVTLVLAYFLGSAVSPLATQLLDDQDMPIVKIQEIRGDLYMWYFDWVDAESSFEKPKTPTFLAVGALINCLPPPHPDAEIRRIPRKCLRVAENLFLLQEEAVLRLGSDKTERVTRLHEQVIVLRGAVFNGFVFVVLCWFAYFSRPRGEPFSVIWSSPAWIGKTLMAAGLAGVLIIVATYLGHADLCQHDVTDPPIMESGLLFLGMVGVFTTLRGTTKRPYIPGALVLGLLFTALAYGAWSWTEVLYDQSVIGAYFTQP
jgi:hypothetical protein